MQGTYLDVSPTIAHAQAEDMRGQVVPLEMNEADFRNTMSLLDDAAEINAGQ